MNFFKLTKLKFFLTLFLFCFSFQFFIQLILFVDGARSWVESLLFLLSYILSLPAHFFKFSDAHALNWFGLTFIANVVWSYLLVCAVYYLFRKARGVN